MRYIFAVFRIGIMTVCTFEQKLFTVDRDRFVLRIGCDTITICIYFWFCKLDLTESKLLGNASHVGACLGIVQGQNHRVQIRRLSRPQFRWKNQFAASCRNAAVGITVCCRNGIQIHRHIVDKHLSVLIIKTYIHFITFCCCLGSICYGYIQLHRCIFVVLIEICLYFIVLDMYQRCRIQVYITENTAIIIHILIFHPSTVTEFVNFNCQKVVASVCCQIIGNIKAMWTVAVLAVSYFFAIYIYIIGRFYALEGKINSSVCCLHVIGHLKSLAVKTYRVIICRCIRGTDITVIFWLPRHSYIGIDRKIKSLSRPAARKLQICFPVVRRCFVVGLIEIFVCITLCECLVL